MSGIPAGVVLSEYAREYVADPAAARKRSVALRRQEERKYGGRQHMLDAVRQRCKARRIEAVLAGTAEGLGATE